MEKALPTYIGRDAVWRFIQYCDDEDLHDFLLIADENTYSVLGRRVEQALVAYGADCVTVVLQGEEVIADATHIMQVFLRTDRKKRVFLAVGSGTITDIARFVSHRSRTSFISLPTAPSVDGFNSTGAPLVINGLKWTVPCHSPAALFADLDTLCSAPPRLIASGFGDMIGKLLSTADWKLGHLLWDERFDEGIARRSYGKACDCVKNIDEIGARSEKGIEILMDGLIESGFCMLEFGTSAPASGAEHHISHFWEMSLLWQHRPAVLHGAKVGVASVLTAQWYKQIREFTREDVLARFGAQPLDHEEEINRITAVFGSVAPELIQDQRSFLELTGERFDSLKERTVACWDDVRAIAEKVPEPDQLVGWYRQVGGPVSSTELGLSNDQVAQAKACAHYLRNRFTINKLRIFLGIP